MTLSREEAEITDCTTIAMLVRIGVCTLLPHGIEAAMAVFSVMKVSCRWKICSNSVNRSSYAFAFVAAF